MLKMNFQLGKSNADENKLINYQAADRIEIIAALKQSIILLSAKTRLKELIIIAIFQIEIVFSSLASQIAERSYQLIKINQIRKTLVIFQLI
jgi:hypothetical protein